MGACVYVSPCAFIGKGKVHSVGMDIAYDSSNEAIDAACKSPQAIHTETDMPYKKL